MKKGLIVTIALIGIFVFTGIASAYGIEPGICIADYRGDTVRSQKVIIVDSDSESNAGINDTEVGVIIYGEHRKVTINQSGKIITLYINSKQATINNRLVDIDAAPMIVENRTVVPLRFITENLGLKTEWDNTTKSILLSDTIVKYPKNNKDENVIIPISTVDSYSIKVNNDGTRIAKLTLNKANNNVIVGGNIIIIPFNDRYTTGVILEIIKDTDNPNKLVIICTELEVPEECKR